MHWFLDIILKPDDSYFSLEAVYVEDIIKYKPKSEQAKIISDQRVMDLKNLLKQVVADAVDAFVPK